MEDYDIVIIGAGAAGMLCAAAAAQRGRRVLVLDHAQAAGEKIRISGGGRCNFTNINASPAQFLSQNPHFCKSALSRFSARDFISMVERHGIAYHEKTLGQLFCDGSAQQIIHMLLAEMQKGGAELRLNQSVDRVEKSTTGFTLYLSTQTRIACQSLVIATGGKSIPAMGASDFAYRIARQFGLRLTEIRPALVPLTFDGQLLQRAKALTGIALPARIHCGSAQFAEAMLFTHRGLSGPAILQISSYWREGKTITVNMLPGDDVLALLRSAKQQNGKQAPHTFLTNYLPRRLAKDIADHHAGTGNLADLSDAKLHALTDAIQNWQILPSGSEGYRTAEVTLGGIDTQDLDSRSMAAKAVPGLYFIGEAVDVTGWLGGYNFQWAWSSGWSAGQAA